MTGLDTTYVVWKLSQKNLFEYRSPVWILPMWFGNVAGFLFSCVGYNRLDTTYVVWKPDGPRGLNQMDVVWILPMWFGNSAPLIRGAFLFAFGYYLYGLETDIHIFYIFFTFTFL